MHLTIEIDEINAVVKDLVLVKSFILIFCHIYIYNINNNNIF